MLHLIGLGLGTQKDITVKGLEIVKQCDVIYLENYTSILQCPKEDLEKLYGKEIILANREMTEQGDEKIISEAKDKDVAFLIVGDVFGATTHVQLFKLAKEKGVEVNIVNNASILTAVGITGLELYKFGKITSIPFDNPNLETPYDVLSANQKMGLHTLFLLDLRPEEDRFMSVNEALEILETIESKKQEGLVTNDTLVVGCARLGSDNVVKSGTISELKNFDFGSPLHCLIIPGKMHFVEEEMVEMWK